MAVKNIKPGCKFCPPREKFAYIAENNHAIAIICDTAKSWGHSLIIPKDHSYNLASDGMNETIWKKGIIPLLRETIEKFKKNPQVIGFHINSNAGISADQSVFHTHLHLVPRYKKAVSGYEDGFSCDIHGNDWNKNKGYGYFQHKWEDCYKFIKEHIEKLVEEGKLKKENSEGWEAIVSFNLFARVGQVDGGNYTNEHFYIIPKPSNYEWMKGKTTSVDWSTRQKIAEKIKNEKWEEESTEKPNTPKKDKPTERPTKNNDNQQPNQNGNSDNSEKDKNKPTDNQSPTSPSNKNGNDNDRGEENNKDGNGEQKPSNDNGSDNNPDQQKKKNNPSTFIPNSIKQYFKKYNIQKIELDGENWIITYKNKKENKIIPVADAPEIQDLKNYLQSQGISSLDDSSFKTNLSSSKPNEVKYWPWVLGIGGVLIVGIIVWVVRKKQRKSNK